MGVNGQENQIEYSEPVTYNHCFGYLVLFRLRRSVHIPSQTPTVLPLISRYLRNAISVIFIARDST